MLVASSVLRLSHFSVLTSKIAAVDALLARAGTDKTRILMAQIFLADLADYDGMNEVWDAWVAAGHAPPRATVQAALAKNEWRVEMVITAACAG